jgi:hypothetical protein
LNIPSGTYPTAFVSAYSAVRVCEVSAQQVPSS